MKLDVLDRENNKLEEFNIDDALLNEKVKDDLLHDVVLAYLNNSHTGSSNTKTRGEVSGGGVKPWRQKGTGRARHGSIRSPIWKGGGVVFGPKPGKKRIRINKNMKKKALRAVVAGKIRDNEIVVINTFEMERPKTKDAAGMLKRLNLGAKKLLIGVDKKDESFVMSARNLKNVKLVPAKDLNVYELLVYPKVLLTKKTMKELVRRMG